MQGDTNTDIDVAGALLPVCLAKIDPNKNTNETHITAAALLGRFSACCQL